MDTCSDIEKYKNNLVNITNSCNLTIGAAYYVAKDFFRDLEKVYLQTIKSEDEDNKTTETIIWKSDELEEEQQASSSFDNNIKEEE